MALQRGDYRAVREMRVPGLCTVLILILAQGHDMVWGLDTGLRYDPALGRNVGLGIGWDWG